MAPPHDSDDPRASDADQPTVRDWASQLAARFLPPGVRARAVDVDITAPSEVERDQSVAFDVTLRNRLPVPVELDTGLRPWYWHVDGVHDADRAEPDPDGQLLGESGTLAFGPREAKELSLSWDGRVRADEDGPFLPLDPGEHELGVEVTATNAARPRAVHRFRVV
ncbi:hypothetical protein [Halorussus halobius]|uniref:hypothetical protein n=1 Tax=Halorussus halobius TaxID=1710537 RepID=UPI001093082A|nr:hypothetical protein [Halorussus halobius]